MAEQYCKMLEQYVAQCWLTYHTVSEVHEAIDKFMEELGL